MIIDEVPVHAGPPYGTRHVVFSHGKESGPWGSKIRALAAVATAAGWAVDSVDYQGMADPAARVAKLVTAGRSAAGRSSAELKVASARGGSDGRSGGFGGPDGRRGGGVGGGIGVFISPAHAKSREGKDHHFLSLL